MHYGLLPRANRGIFAINELPDLAGKIQVGLFNILQEGDVQIKGYPVRLPLDVMLVFTANPEDYTARGKIITPLKDRIGSEIRTHYPPTRENAMAITAQEAWIDRADDGLQVQVPAFVREVVEEIAFQARDDKKIDKRSGVSQRMPITSLENVVSNAERRALRRLRARRGARASPTSTRRCRRSPGKFELEYEGELKGAESVARELVRAAVANVFTGYVRGGRHARRSSAGSTRAARCSWATPSPASEVLEQAKRVPGLLELSPVVGTRAWRAGARGRRRPWTSSSRACTR